MKFDVSIKSGTSDHFSPDGCDLKVCTLESELLPRIGETIMIHKFENYRDLLVTKVERLYMDKKEFATVYVIKC